MTTQVLLETTRLILRTVTMDDAEDVALSWRLDDEPISREQAANQVMWMLHNHKQNDAARLIHLCLAIIHKDTQEFIGWCGLDHRAQTNAHPVLFYVLRAGYWGQGLATEAAKTVLDYAFGDLGQARIDGGAASENLASKRVMEKIGMKHLGFDEEGGYSFALTQDEYRQGKMGPL